MLQKGRTVTADRFHEVIILLPPSGRFNVAELLSVTSDLSVMRQPTFQQVTDPSTQLHFSLWRIAVPQTMTLSEDLERPQFLLNLSPALQRPLVSRSQKRKRFSHFPDRKWK
ncbi:hypothetical protein CEXT_294691 [Caerostris extrusa]|uniref:Uncharacterized protein n=1 Tax=Caerostris extrusa TaxID=172846 RepID=A0AAV4PDA4_CAEEX|nr:hypothetical protein CEXT_294691 [Caerostris extrusa]